MKDVQISGAELRDYDALNRFNAMPGLSHASHRTRLKSHGVRIPHREHGKKSKIFITVFVAALPALAAFVMWLADPHGTAAFYATRMGQTLFYAGLLWVGIGMLKVRRMVVSRTIPPRLSSAW